MYDSTECVVLLLYLYFHIFSTSSIILPRCKCNSNIIWFFYVSHWASPCLNFCSSWLIYLLVSNFTLLCLFKWSCHIIVYFALIIYLYLFMPYSTNCISCRFGITMRIFDLYVSQYDIFVLIFHCLILSSIRNHWTHCSIRNHWTHRNAWVIWVISWCINFSPVYPLKPILDDVPTFIQCTYLCTL